MARNGPTVILEQEQDTITLQITDASVMYQLTYKNKPFGIRRLVPGLGTLKKVYGKTTYDNEGSARATTRRLNQIFNTTDFAYKRIVF
jgi:hypothetical protein